MINRIRELLARTSCWAPVFCSWKGSEPGSREGHAPPDTVDFDLGTVTARFLDIVFPYGIVLAGLSVAISLFRSLAYGWHSTFAWHLAMYASGVIVLVLRRRIPTLFVICFFLGLISVDFIHSLLTMGLAGCGLLMLTSLCAFAGIFIGVRTGMAFVGGGALVTMLIGAGVWTGTIATGVNGAQYLATPFAWLIQVACFVMYTVPLMIAAHVIHQGMVKSLGEMRTMNRQLQNEMSMRRRAEEGFRGSESRYRHIFEHAAEGIFQVAPKGKPLGVNPALARMAGYSSPQEMIAGINDRGDHLTFDPEQRAFLRQMLEEEGHAEGVELRIWTKDMKMVWARVNVRSVLDEKGNVLYYEGTAEDVTKRKLAELALQESEAQYRAVVENSLVASYIVQDGLFRFVNARFCAITGYTRREIVDRMGLADIVYPEYRSVLQDNISRIGSDHLESLGLELKIVRKDEGVVTVKVLAGSTTYKGRLAHFGTFVDISKERTLEAQLRQAQKMEAIGTLAGGVAHDFNNILTALTGYGTLLRLKLDTADPLRHYVDQILSASQKAAGLTQSLLTFGRRQPVSLKPIDINTVIKGTEGLLRRLITEDIRLVTNLARESMVVMADPTQLDQILFNLVSNARDAMPGGGTLTITTEFASIGPEFIKRNGFGESGRYALISVSDTGIGMDDETKERIFDPFFTTKEVGRGTGLGLSTVYGIVKQHCGYICVSSAPSRGASFSIYLPVMKTVAEELCPLPTELKESSTTVLLADDSPEVRYLLKDVLEHFGYTVVEAGDGEEAVERFKENEGISLVVLDSVMPNKNGRQAYDAMKAMRPEVKVLFMSGHTSDTVLDKGIIAGEFDFIQKPLSPPDFLRKVEAIIAR